MSEEDAIMMAGISFIAALAFIALLVCCLV